MVGSNSNVNIPSFPPPQAPERISSQVLGGGSTAMNVSIMSAGKGVFGNKPVMDQMPLPLAIVRGLMDYTSNSLQSFVTPDYALSVAQSIVSLIPDCSIILSSHKPINITSERIIDGSVLLFLFAKTNSF
jgi:hypothetical protein